MVRAARLAVLLIVVIVAGLALARTSAGQRLLVGLGLATACDSGCS